MTLQEFANIFRRGTIAILLACAAGLGTAPLAAQVQTVDPNTAIDGDLSSSHSTAAQPTYRPSYPPAQTQTAPAPSVGAVPQNRVADLPPDQAPYQGASQAPYPASQPVVTSSDPSRAAGQAAGNPAVASQQGATYKKDDLIGAAEGVFGKGAEGLARMIEWILKKQGEPNGYIVGREGGGAFIFGARYGSGTLYHKIEGQMPVYWTGPSLGLDVGANAANTFVLVYNLYDTNDLFHRYAQGEGQAYLVGGFHVSYLRRGDVVLIPVRMGAGLRLGINVGYMKFSRKQKWVPF